MQEEIAENLTLELDFLNEAANMKRAAANFGQPMDNLPINQSDNRSINPLVKIPIVFDHMTTRRILTMEFINGVKINQIDRLVKSEDPHADDQSIKRITNQILTETITALSEQIFCHGFVNCDPHSGNIMVCRHKDLDQKLNPIDQSNHHSITPSTFRIVLIDWGLCRSIDQSVRSNYCKLWESLIMNDDDGVKEAFRQLGLPIDEDQPAVQATNLPINSSTNQPFKQHPAAWEIIAMSILMRPYKSKQRTKQSNKKSKKHGDFTKKLSPAELVELRRMINQSINQFLDQFQLLPRELLLVLRAQNYIRFLSADIGKGDVNRFKIMARTAVRGRSINHINDQLEEFGRPSIFGSINQSISHLRSLLHRLRFEAALTYIDVWKWLEQQWLAHFAPSGLLEEIEAATGESRKTLFG